MSQVPYADPYAGQPAQPRGTNVMSILSLVFAFVFSPLGIAFGHIARHQIKRTGEQGRGLATAGLVLGYIFFVFGIIYIVVVIALIAHGASTTTG